MKTCEGGCPGAKRKFSHSCWNEPARGGSWRWRLLTAAASKSQLLISMLSGVVGLSGCTLIVDAETTQCETDADCEARGAPFAGMVCEQQLCMSKDSPSPSEGLECAAPSSNGRSKVNFSFATQLPTSGKEAEPLQIQACQQLDVDCQEPIAGPYAVPVGTLHEFSLPHGFSGFFQIASTTTLPALYFLPRPVVTDTIGWSPTVLSKDVLAQLAGAAGVSLDPDSGVVLASVRDCAGAPVADVSVTASEPQALRFYIVNNLPVLSETATGAQGAVGFVNVPATTIVLDGVAASGEVFQPVSVRVKAGALSLVEMRP